MEALRLPSRTDVLVVGAGPAGASAAILLADHGLDVLVAEKRPLLRMAHAGAAVSNPARPGLSLPAKVESLLALVGLLRMTDRADFVRMPGRMVRRGADMRVETFDPEGGSLGYQVERELLDDLLVARARSVGCLVADACTVVGWGVDAALRADEGVEVRLSRDEEVSSVWARFIVDASGSSMLAGTQFDLRQLPEPQTLVLSGRWASPRKEQDPALSNTLLELLPDGWVMSSVYRGSVRDVHVGFDAASAELKSVSQRLDLYESLLSSSALVGPLVKNARLIAPISLASSNPRFVRQHVGDRFLIAGDASFSADLLLGQGAYNAFYSGILAAAVTRTVLKRPDDAQMALDYFDEVQRTSRIESDQAARAFYREVSASGSVPGSFWDARCPQGHDVSEAQKSVAALPCAALERLRRASLEHARLRLSASAGLELRPGPQDGFICLRPTFCVRGQPFGAADLDPSLLSTLLDGRTLGQVFGGYADAVGASPDDKGVRELLMAALSRLLALDALVVEG